jgi:hypothetical protein
MNTTHNLRLLLAPLLASTASASIIFDDFNVDLGHFNLAPGFSGSSVGEDAASSNVRLETEGPFEGLGHQKLTLIHDATSTALRIRHLSGGGTPASNVSFTTTAGEDGWIGFYAKTSDAGLTAQLWIEGAENNGGTPQSLLADGEWHLYEWNLDDETGGPTGWGAVAGIVAGDADVQIGTYTIDSIIFRGGTTPSTTQVVYVDFVAKSDSGSVAGLIPEPSSAMLLGLGVLGLAGRRGRKR